MKEFNTTAVCIPSKHYMVDISERVEEIKKLVDDGKYFTINRGRQYGKTTTLNELCKTLKNDHIVINLDFQDLGEGSFASGGVFSQSIAKLIIDLIVFDDLKIPKKTAEELNELIKKAKEDVNPDDLFRIFRYWLAEESKPVVLIIDEVDSASNNQVFLDFLAQLRSLYIKSEINPGFRTFQSVILAGVTDVKHLRGKIRDEGQHKINSPWNIAADFDMDMSLSEEGIAGMLEDYEADHHTGMNVTDMAKEIRDYTGGYPFLVSRLCQLIDRQVRVQLGGLEKAWTRQGMDEAVKLILSERNTLFDSLISKVNNYPDIRAALRRILIEGSRLTYNGYQEEISQLQMYGFIKNEGGTVRISNRIFETLLYNMFLSDEE